MTLPLWPAAGGPPDGVVRSTAPGVVPHGSAAFFGRSSSLSALPQSIRVGDRSKAVISNARVLMALPEGSLQDIGGGVEPWLSPGAPFFPTSLPTPKLVYPAQPTILPRVLGRHNRTPRVEAVLPGEDALVADAAGEQLVAPEAMKAVGATPHGVVPSRKTFVR